MASKTTTVANDTTLHVPSKAAKWLLEKFDPLTSEMKRAAWHERGTKVFEWSVSGDTCPTAEFIRSRWGSGTYRVIYRGASGRAAGTSPRVYDDPAEPDLGLYPNDPANRPPPVIAPPPAHRGIVGHGGVQLGEVPRHIDVAAWEYMRQQARADSEAVILNMRLSHEADMQRAQQMHALQLAALTQNTRAQVDIARAAVTPPPAAPSPELVELTSQLRALTLARATEPDDEDEDEPQRQADPNMQLLLGLVAQHGPAIADWVRRQVVAPPPPPHAQAVNA